MFAFCSGDAEEAFTAAIAASRPLTSAEAVTYCVASPASPLIWYADASAPALPAALIPASFPALTAPLTSALFPASLPACSAAERSVPADALSTIWPASVLIEAAPPLIEEAPSFTPLIPWETAAIPSRIVPSPSERAPT